MGKSDDKCTPGNTASDGTYVVGKGKPPQHSKFRVGDGRNRGRRMKGTKNLATDFKEEFGARMTVTLNGQPRRVSRQRAIVMRLADNATRGQNVAIAMALECQQRLVDTQITKDAAEEQPDYSRLTREEMRALEWLMTKSLRRESEYALPEPRVIFVPRTYGEPNEG